MRSGAVAKAAGVNLQTLRYYERRGLIAEPQRSLGGHRVYPAEAVTVLKVVKAAQRLGFSLDEIADLLDVGRHRHSTRRHNRVASRASARPRSPTSNSFANDFARSRQPVATTYWHARMSRAAPSRSSRSPMSDPG
jgi:DNA-binding transcriptional MerR regulator